MPPTITISADTRTTAGILLLTIVAIQYGGYFMLRVVRGDQPVTSFQQAFFRAGHAHAGVLVILSLVALLYADATSATGILSILSRNAIPLAAILMSAGFFFAATGRGLTQPNRFIFILYLGVASLAIGVISLGISLLTT